MASAQTCSGFNQLVEFTVNPAQQTALVAALTEQVARYTCTYPGFISASIQASNDGSRVLNQMHWHTRQAAEAALLNAECNGQDFTAMLSRHHVTAVTFNTYHVTGVIKPRDL